MTASSRRVNASSMFARRLVAGSRCRRTAPSAAAGTRPRRSRSGRARRETSERLPNSASASSKKQDAVHPVGLGEDASRFFSVSPMYLSTTRREVDRVQVEPEIAGHDLGRHRLAGARSRRRTAPVMPRPFEPSGCRGPTRRAPVSRWRRAGGELAERRDLLAGQHQIGEVDVRRDAAGEPLELGRVLRPRAGAEVVGVTGRPRERRLQLRRERRARDLQRAEPELGRCRLRRRGHRRPRRRRGSRATSRRALRRRASPTSTSSGTPRDRSGFHELGARTARSASRPRRRHGRRGRRGASERVERAGDEPRAAQPRLAARATACDGCDVVVRRRGDARSSTTAARRELGERRDRERPAAEPSRASRRYASRDPARRAPASAAGSASRGRPGLAEQRQQQRVRPVVAEQVHGHAVGYAQPRVRNGRSGSSTSTSPASTSGAPALQTARARPLRGAARLQARARARCSRAGGVTSSCR